MIKLVNLSKSYNQKIVLDNVNLEIPAGTFTAISGDSGSGKSTLLNIIGGLEPPTQGDIIIDGKNIKELSRKEKINFYRKTIGIIFQGSYMDPQLTLKENITLPGVFAGVKKSIRDAKAIQLAEKLGISEQLEQLPRESSGGEIERAAIARALLLNPKIILADEPTANLDPANSQKVLRVLRNLCSELNITIIVASHDILASNFATKILTIENNTVREAK